MRVLAHLNPLDCRRELPLRRWLLLASALGFVYCAGSGPLSGQTQPMERDEAYREALERLEELGATWKQQPGNVAALKRTSESLRGAIVALRESAPAAPTEPEQPELAPEAPSTPKTGQVTPRGPYRPSGEPSPPSESQAREEATERFLPGPQLAPAPVKTLQGVPSELVQASCNDFLSELDRLDEHLAATDIEDEEVAASLESLTRIFSDMRKGPPTEPK